MHSTPITIPPAPYNSTLTYINFQLPSFAYSTKLIMIEELNCFKFAIVFELQPLKDHICCKLDDYNSPFKC